MRISDWSSDVCSSDLHALRRIQVHHLGVSRRSRGPFKPHAHVTVLTSSPDSPRVTHSHVKCAMYTLDHCLLSLECHGGSPPPTSWAARRSGERRVGKRGVLTGRSRWSPAL